VSLLKLGWPAVPSWALVVSAIALGIGASMLVSIGSKAVLSSDVLAVNTIQGILAAAAAAGVDRTGTIAQAKRDAKQEELGPPPL
jgi:hypothetical protein